MKINEVETLVGVTKRNIRYYEKEGLLQPGRNSDNGYRDYEQTDVEELKKIKLLRKLDVPLDEIRKMQQGGLTLSDGLRRHIISLERERANLGSMQTLCTVLVEDEAQLAGLNTDQYLTRMESLEQEGARFMNIKKHDTLTRYVAPIISAAVFIAFMGGIIALLVWAFTLDPVDAPPLALTIFLVAIPGVTILGVLLALIQRFKQLRGGEEDAASKY